MSKENENLNEAENSALNIADVSKSLAPHRCPVCNGNGLVPNGFYMQTSGHWSTSSITPTPTVARQNNSRTFNHK